MRPSNGLSPYPVLAPYRDDFQGSQIATTIDAHMTTEKLTLKVDFTLDDPTLLDLIEADMANYAVHVECGSTSYRRIFRGTSPHFEEEVPSEQLANDFDVSSFIVAICDISNYKSASFHPDYSENAFEIYRGNILAIGDCVNVTINDDDNGLPPSIIKIAQGSERQEASIQINTDGDKYIVVSLQPALYKLYLQMGEGIYNETIFSLVLLPVLASVLSQMAQDQSNEDKYWFQSIERILDANDITLTDIADGPSKYSPLAVAQKIFDEPILRSLQNLSAQVETYDNED